MDFIPALSILGVFLIISLTLIYKFKTDEILKIFESKNFFLLGTLVVIFLLLTFYLFSKNENWVADLLKIAIGVFAGSGAIAMKDKDKEKEKSVAENSLSLDNTTISGQGNKLAGLDINETVQNIEKAFGDIKDSVINQDNKIQQFLSSSGQLDHCIHMIYSRQRIFSDMQQIISRRLDEGWTLTNIEFALETIDGVILLFTRAKENDVPEFTVFRDTNFEQLVTREN